MVITRIEPLKPFPNHEGAKATFAHWDASSELLKGRFAG
ncbi:hypothetical protein Z946_3271 [Sulfitobacter noctilucicola]|nr:hypothetical protein Z946_3271 [Sulfitobacter noctilucicola]